MPSHRIPPGVFDTPSRVSFRDRRKESTQLNDCATEAFTTALPTPRVARMYSELFMNSFLNPIPVGCHDHGDPECLCDVDASLTAGYVWDQPPKELVGVHDADGLVAAASSVWLAKDLCKPRLEVNDNSLDRLHEQIPELAKLAREWYTYDEIIALDYQITRDEWKLICEAVGTRSATARVPDGRIRALRIQGLSYRQITERLRQETGRSISLASIGPSLARTGTTGVGPPRRGIPTELVERWYLDGMTDSQVLDKLHQAGYTHVWRQSIQRIRRRVLNVVD